MYFPAFKGSIFFKASSSSTSCTLRGERPALAGENSAQPESDLPAVLNCPPPSLPGCRRSPCAAQASSRALDSADFLCAGLRAESHPREAASPEFHCGRWAALLNTDSSLHLASFHWVLATVIWRNPLIKNFFLLPLATASVPTPSCSSRPVILAFPFFLSQSFFRGDSDDEHGKKPHWLSFFLLLLQSLSSMGLRKGPGTCSDTGSAAMNRAILHLRKTIEIRKSYDGQGQVEPPDEPFAHTCRNESYSERYEVYFGKATYILLFGVFVLLWITWPIICQYKSWQGGPAAENSPKEYFAEILTSFLLEKMPVGQFSFRHKRACGPPQAQIYLWWKTSGSLMTAEV